MKARVAARRAEVRDAADTEIEIAADPDFAGGLPTQGLPTQPPLHPRESVFDRS